MVPIGWNCPNEFSTTRRSPAEFVSFRKPTSDARIGKRKH
jgi:hypothetical protein